MLTCKCVAEWHSDSVCLYWECEEESLYMCHSIAPGWCNVKDSVGYGGGFGMLGVISVCTVFLDIPSICDPSRSSISYLGCTLGIAWCISWSFPVVIWGGVDGAVFVMVMWGFPLLLCAFFGRYTRAARRKMT